MKPRKSIKKGRMKEKKIERDRLEKDTDKDTIYDGSE